MIASELERDILPARVTDHRLGDIDALLSSGEVVWVGRESLGERDGRIALYLAGSLGKLRQNATASSQSLPCGE